MTMPETKYCAVKGCARPSRSTADQAFGDLRLRIWLCERHGGEITVPELEIDLSRAVCLLTAKAEVKA